MIAEKDRDDWAKDCMQWRGRVLTGEHSHWCFEWDALPVDETCAEWPCRCCETCDGVPARAV